MSSPNRHLFRTAFRQASPILGRSADEEDFDPRVLPDNSMEEAEFARKMASSIERLTDIARRDSFSSISSCGQREQFQTALTNLQSTVFGEREKTPTMEREPHPSGSMDSDHEFEHLDAPDPVEFAQYSSVTRSKPQTMSTEHTPDPSPVHAPHEPQQRPQVDDPLADLLADMKRMSDQAAHTGHDENLLVDLSSPSQETAHSPPHLNAEPHLDMYGQSGVQANAPELFDHVESAPVLQQEASSGPPATGRFPSPPTGQKSPEAAVASPKKSPSPPPAHRSPSPPAPAQPSPVVPEEPIEDFVNEVIPDPTRHTPLEEDRRSIEEGVDSAVKDTQDQVDAILERLNRESPDLAQQAPDLNSPSGDSGRDTLGGLLGESVPESHLPASDSITGMREMSPDEAPHDRQGPLTIPMSATETPKQPEQPSPPQEELPSAPAFEDEYEQVHSPSSHFDELPARPPTPPKDITDEEVQPGNLDLGPPHHVHEKHSDSGLKPILKHSYASDGRGAWIDFKSVDPRVLDILYWRDPKKSGIALGVILLVIFLACKFTFLSLISNLALLALAGALGFRVFKLVEAQIKKTDGANPFNPYLQHELDVPQDRIHAQVDVLVENGRNLAVQLRRLFLCENICESVKFGLFLWTLTYVGAWFSGQALVILFVLGCFSVPKVYEIYKEPIDANLAVARENVEKVHALVADKLPFLKCGGKAESKKEE